MNEEITPERECAFCGIKEWIHKHKKTVNNHPFFENNLVYLEWEADKNV